MLIDAHTHAFLPEDLKLLSERMELMDSSLADHDPNKWQIFGQGDVDDLVKRVIGSGVDKLVLLPVSGKKERTRELIRWAARAAGKHPQIIPFGILHPHGEVEKDLDLLLELGLKGVKLHPFVQRFVLDDPATDRLLGCLEDAGLPVLLDTLYLPGLLKAKPHLDWMVQGYDSPSCTPEQIARLAQAHPRLKIVAAHLGSLYGWEHTEPLMHLDNVYLDISWIDGLVPEKEVVKVIRRKGPERVIYGSDAPWRDPVQFRAWFEDLPLTGMEREQIASFTILSLLDHRPS